MQDPAADALIVGKVLAGDPAGHAELYDSHAAALYEYCLSMLRDRERAIGALGITFMIAAGRMAELREPARLRPWLYALARDECRRRAAGAADRPDAAGPNASLFTDAIAGLPWDDREIVGLCLRHRLLGENLAAALGVPAARVPAAVAASRVRLQRALGALFVARTGRGDCWELARLLVGWDGESSESVIQDVRAHIGSCATCQAREWRELPSWQVLADRRPAGEAPVPPGVRADVLALLAEVSTPSDDLIADLVKHRAGAFGTSGFPARRGHTRRPPAQVAGAAAGVAAAGAVIVMFAARPGGGSPAPALVQATKPAAASSVAHPLGHGKAAPHARATDRKPKKKHKHKNGTPVVDPAPGLTPRASAGLPSSGASGAPATGSPKPSTSPSAASSASSSPPASTSPAPATPPATSPASSTSPTPA